MDIASDCEQNVLSRSHPIGIKDVSDTNSRLIKESRVYKPEHQNYRLQNTEIVIFYSKFCQTHNRYYYIFPNIGYY